MSSTALLIAIVILVVVVVAVAAFAMRQNRRRQLRHPRRNRDAVDGPAPVAVRNDRVR